MARPIIDGSIDVTKIDKSLLPPPTGDNGARYMPFAFFEKPGRNSDGFITQGTTREQRDKGLKGPIIGNWSYKDGDSGSTPTAQLKSQAADADIDF